MRRVISVAWCIQAGVLLFACVFSKLRASSDYYKRDRTRDLRSMLCKGFDRKKGLKKEPRDALKLLREQDEFVNKRHCLSTGLRLQTKAI